MALAIIGIGVPGSGKTTVLKPLAEEHGLAYINKDEIRQELLGDVEDQSKNREVWLESQKRTEDALRDGRSVVLDSTYIERWKRKELIKFLRRSGASRVVGLYFDVPFETAMERNNLRARVISDESMRWFGQQIAKAPPAVSEGFDRLYTLQEFGEFKKELI